MARMSDLIDRQAAIDATWKAPSYTDPLNVLTEVRDRIAALPPAQPELKTEAVVRNGDTLIVNANGMDGIRRVILDYGVWCDQFYLDGGDDGE